MADSYTPTEQEREGTERLFQMLTDALDEHAETNTFTVGMAMNALFSVMVATAKSSPGYDPKKFVAETDAAIRGAVGLQ